MFSSGRCLAALRSVASAALCLSASLCAAQHPVSVWLTTADGVNLLKPQTQIAWTPAAGSNAIQIDATQRFQKIDGFGHALTGGSAQLLMKMSAPARKVLLDELFGDGTANIHTSYLRVSIGASDMNDHVFTYDDLPPGDSDPELRHFSVTASEDQQDVIPILQQILAIQPTLKVVASPWTAPAWMKDNGGFKGGSLKPEFYDVYARYLVKYIQAMQAAGIIIAALTPQNEPENSNNTPSLLMSAPEEADFIGKHLGPAIEAAHLKTKIIAYDHNADHPRYSETVLADPDAARYTDGSGFHLYLGSVTALTQVHDAFPGKNIYFTEQMVIPAKHGPVLSIAEPVARVIIGATQNWARTVLLWNLDADPQNGPHTPNGGCSICTGAFTLDGDRVTRLVAYYTAAHASKFVPPDSVRIGSAPEAGTPGDEDKGTQSVILPHVAFLTPTGDHVLIVSNITAKEQQVRIRFAKQDAVAQLGAGAVATYVW